MDADVVNLALILAVAAGTVIASVVIRSRRPLINPAKPSRFALAMYLFGPTVGCVVAIGLLFFGRTSVSPWIPLWIVILCVYGPIWWLLSRRTSA